ncbi:MAG TPA: tetratricopeptide repeat protein [Thermoanaerobaculia bacterium]|jgi:hypothetical protein
MTRRLLLLVLLLLATAAAADDLRTAEELAWNKRFAESEALYRRILEREPQSSAARLGLARVVMWQGRYGEAIAMFRELQGVDALEGLATAEYWSGDLRRAARDFRRVLALDPQREFAATSLREIESAARPSDRIVVDATHDDQPLDGIRVTAATSFFSDPLTRWSVAGGAYRLDAGRIGTRDGRYVALENETRLGAITVDASLGLFEFPDGVRRTVGSLGARRGSLSLRVDRREEIASATSLRTHASSTNVTLRWSHERDWIGAAEVTARRYFDGNDGRAAVAYAVFPLRRGDWTFWSGASGAARDTDESRFRITAQSSTFEQGVFRYSYRGEYDPYWTPVDLVEARAVFALERRGTRGSVKLHADGGWARDRGRAFGPDLGTAPFPPATFAFDYRRTYRPWRAGVSGDVAIAARWRIEAGVERGATVDYRSTTLHAALVRRR